MVVDDDPDFVQATRLVLETHGYKVATAADGNEGLTKVIREQPDLVVLDVVMTSVLDGLHMSEAMHNDPVGREIPVVMVTSIANIDYAALFPTDENIHIDAFLTKPVAAERLLAEVGRLLDGK